MWNQKNKMRDANEFTYWTAIDLENELMVAEGKDGGRDSQGVWDGRGHTAVLNMENQQGPAAQHGELCSMSRGSLDGRDV